MESEKSDQDGAVVEWTIENFTCWNNQVHGERILQEEIGIKGKYFNLELYPMGIDEYLVVRVYDKNRSTNFELSIIDSKGSLLWKETICNPTWEDNLMKIPTNLIFKDIVKNIVQDPMFKDFITLRYNRKCSYNEVYLDQSKIDAVDRLLRISSETLRDLPLTDRIETRFVYWRDECYKNYRFYVSSIQSTVDGIECSFELATPGEDGLFHCYLYALNADNSSVMFEKNEHLKADKKNYEFIFSLPKDLIEEVFSLLIRFKMVYGNKYVNYEYVSYDPKMPIISNILHSSKENNSKSVMVKKDEHPDNALSILSKELMCLYQDHDLSDFQLRCDSVTFPVHKNILIARSPVFKCMLALDMKEAASGFMDVKDLDPHTLGRFLAFLYSGAATGEALQWDEALKLYYAGDKYQVPSLKTECAAVLKEQVSVSNVCNILALADKHQDEHLTSVARDFILDNFNCVLQSEEWMRFMEQDPLLFGKTLTLLVKNRKLT